MGRRSTDPRAARHAALAGLCVAALLAAASGAEELPPLRLFATPAVITAAEAGGHVDEVVVVAMRVAEVKAEPGRVVLLPPAADGDFRIVIVPPLIGEAPRRLAERFREREVRATGKIREFAGEVEMLVTDPERVAVVGEDEAPGGAGSSDEIAAAPAGTAVVEGAAPATPAPPAVAAKAAGEALAPPPATSAPLPTVAAPAAVAEPSIAPVAAAPAEAEAAATPAPAPVATARPAGRGTAVAARSESAECLEARRDWAEAAVAARAPLDGLAECLAAAMPPCTADLAAVRAALAEIAAHEQRIGWLCDGGGR
jgi:hypothetical protein